MESQNDPVSRLRVQQEHAVRLQAQQAQQARLQEQQTPAEWLQAQQTHAARLQNQQTPEAKLQALQTLLARRTSTAHVTLLQGFEEALQLAELKRLVLLRKGPAKKRVDADAAAGASTSESASPSRPAADAAATIAAGPLHAEAPQALQVPHPAAAAFLSALDLEVACGQGLRPASPAEVTSLGEGSDEL